MKKYITYIIIILSLLGCTKNALVISQGNNYFPNTIGDEWVYNVVDSAQSTPNNPSPPNRYIVKVAITGIRKLADGKYAALWEYQYPWGNDTNYVRIVNDTVQIFFNEYYKIPGDLEYPNLVFLFPFSINERWTGKLMIVDSFRVVDTGEVITPIQTFSNCYKIYHHYGGPNIELQDNYWFKPNIGMVRMDYIDYNNGPVIYRTWQLKSYSLH